MKLCNASTLSWKSMSRCVQLAQKMLHRGCAAPALCCTVAPHHCPEWLSMMMAPAAERAAPSCGPQGQLDAYPSMGERLIVMGTQVSPQMSIRAAAYAACTKCFRWTSGSTKSPFLSDKMSFWPGFRGKAVPQHAILMLIPAQCLCAEERAQRRGCPAAARTQHVAWPSPAAFGPMFEQGSLPWSGTERQSAGCPNNAQARGGSPCL